MQEDLPIPISISPSSVVEASAFRLAAHGGEITPLHSRLSNNRVRICPIATSTVLGVEGKKYSHISPLLGDGLSQTR